MSLAYSAFAALRRSRTANRVFWSYCGLLAVLAVICAVALQGRYGEALRKKRTDADNLSFILSDHLARSLEAVDRSLDLLVAQLGSDAEWSEQDVARLLGVSLAALPDVTTLSVLDRSGKIVHSTFPKVIGTQRHDQYLFKMLAGTREHRLVADTLIVGRSAGRMLLPLGRRLEYGNGEFRGVVAAVLDPKRLLEFYRAVDLGSSGCLWVAHPSAVRIFLEPREAPDACARDVGSASHGYVRSSRTTAISGLEVGVSLSRSSIDARLRQEVGISALIFLALLSCGALAMLLHRNLMRVREAARQTVAKTNDALRRSSEENRYLFATAPDLIFIADKRGRLVRVSPSSAMILGVPAEELEGRPSSDLIAAQDLGRSREALRRARRGEPLRNFEACCPHKNGRMVTLSWSGAWSEEEQKYFLIGRDQTELKQRQEELAAQNLILDAALSTMSQGLAMFDGEQNVVFANEKFASMYGQTSEDVRPGTSLGAIIGHRIKAGYYIGTTVEDVLTRMRERVTRMKPSHVTGRLGDGRTVTVSIEPRPDGGWVTTHQDITEREKLKERLDAALNNMVQGLAMFDADQRLVLCNSRYSGIYGMSDEHCKPGTALSSILEARVAAGVYKTRETRQLIDVGVATFSNEVSEIIHLADGRSISVVRRPLPTGGVISTHEDITERRSMEARLEYLAHHDALTELPNRVSLGETVGRLLACGRSGRQAVVMCIDLDRFKEVNDTLGHAVGDALLQSVSSRLQACLREHDFVARLGGDEFAVVLATAEPHIDAPPLARRIIERISAAHSLLGHQVLVGASIGISVAPSDGDTLEQLLRNADLALYGAKAEGRGTFKFYDVSMHGPVRLRRTLEADLNVAFEQGQFTLAYQPLVTLATGAICGFEALLRWQHPQRGWISPSEFIAAAEATGLIVRIGEWVLREACREAKSWPTQYKIAVNLSPLQVKSPNCMQSIVSALAYSGLDPARLEIEITESVLLGDDDATLNVLRQMHKLGVRIALDDFGTGYSSLSYLRRYPFSKIKIDRSFIADIQSQSALAILKAIAELGASLGMSTTAEGIETEEQLAIARTYGCVEAQGYLLGRPAPAAELRSLITEKPATAA